MKIIIEPQKSNYKIIFTDGMHIEGVGFLSLSETKKGMRPDHYRVRFGTRKQFKNSPPKDLIAQLRHSKVSLTKHDGPFSSFLADLQIPFTIADVCRLCMLEDRLTPLDPRSRVRFVRDEYICMFCAKRELRRELSHLSRLGKRTALYFERLLEKERDLERVTATIEPPEPGSPPSLFDKIEVVRVTKKTSIDELPLPRSFVDRSRVKDLMPVQELAVDSGLLYGKDLLVVSATASGKTFIGEMAGIKNFLEGHGRMLFLVPLVALANQKYERFTERYSDIAKVGILIGKSRINIPENRKIGDHNIHSPIVVGTYEGVDHFIRCGNPLSGIGTVVIDEVQMLEDKERGHRLDGLIARLKHLFPKAQFLYMSATIGIPQSLAKKLNAKLVRYDERPVPLERYLMFLERKEKIPTIKDLVRREFKMKSNKGYHGQTIIFTNSRARCHIISDSIGQGSSPYHAGLTSEERRKVENDFEKGKISAVVTTAALAAGVDFPASLVIFDSLAMGLDWLSVQEFSQMSGRAGRPDYHDLGKVFILAEPGGSYKRGSKVTEEEVALALLQGDMEEVNPVHDIEMSSEEFIANAVICRGSLPCTKSVTNTMVGEVEDVLPLLLKNGFINIQDDKIRISEFAHVMAEHFIGIERLLLIMKMVRDSDDPLEILSELECMDESGLREIGERKGASERKVRTRPERFKKRGTGHPEIF